MKKEIHRYLLNSLILGFLFIQTSLAQEAIESISQDYFQLPDSLLDESLHRGLYDFPSLELRSQVWYLIDSTGSLQIEDLIQEGSFYRFRAYPEEKIFPDIGNFFFRRALPAPAAFIPDREHIVWLRLRLQGNERSRQDYHLHLYFAFEFVDLYEIQNDGRYQIYRTGLNRNPRKTSQVYPGLNTLPLHFDGPERKEFFIRLDRRGPWNLRAFDQRTSLAMTINAGKPDRTSLQQEQQADFIFAGFFAAIFLLFFILFLFIRDRTLLWGALAFALYNAIIDVQLSLSFLSPKGETFFEFGIVPVFLITILLFYREYFKLKSIWPAGDKIMLVYIWCFQVFLSAILFLVNFFPVEEWIPAISDWWTFHGQIRTLLLRAPVILLIILCSYIYLRRTRNFRDWFIWITLALLPILFIASFFFILLNVSPDIWPWGIYYERAMTGILAIGYAIAIGKRFLQTQREKNVAIREKLALQQSINQQLEAQVQVRTDELHEKNQQLVTRNEQLIQLDLEKNNLINIVAHDLGSPLASIKMYSGIVQKAKDKLTTKQREYLDGISATAQRSVEMIRRILDVNAIDQNGLQLELQQTDVLPILKAAVVDFQGLTGRKDIKIITELPEEPVVLNVDPAAFRQVIDNLVSNAIKFSPAGKTVAVGLATEQDHTTRLYVRDQGPGIAPEDMPKLFQRYARLSAQPTSGETSTGLGLAIVRQYVEAMGGQVWAENNEKEGTTFWTMFL